MRALLIVALFLLSGCISNPDYPVGWASVSDEMICQRINGKYRNVGVNHSGHEVSLTSLLFAQNTVGADSIEVLINHDKLTINAFYDGELVKSHAEDIDGSSCKKSFIEIDEPEPEGGINREGVVAITWGAIQLSINENNDLIVHRNSSGAGIVLLFPVAGSSWSWFKFSKVE